MGLRKNKNHGPSTGVVNSSKALKQIKRVEGLIIKDTDIGYVGPHSIGTIFFSDEKSGEIAQDPSSLPYAIPRNRNNITYPVIGEFVIITQGPAPDYYPDLGGSPLSKINYYSDPISVYGNGSNNAVPNQTNTDDHQLGTYFKENVNLSPLKPGEGDTIMEGKNGQRIRFTTTGPDGTNSISRNATDDPNDGNPSIGQRAIIISLGSGISENITADNASIYMFENHSIPLDVASTNVDSLNTTYTPIKDKLETISAKPEEVIPEPIVEPPQVTEIDFTPDPEGDNTVEEIITSDPPPNNDDPFSDPVFDALDEAIDEGILSEITPEEFEYDVEYISLVSEDTPFSEIEGEDPSPQINPNRFGAHYPGPPSSGNPISSTKFSPLFNKFGFNVRKITKKEDIEAYIISGDLVMVGDSNLDSGKYEPKMKSAIKLDGKYYLHKACAPAFNAWQQEMDENGIKYKLTSALRYGKETGGGPHGYGLAVDFGNLFAELADYGVDRGSTNPEVNKQLRINSQNYKDIANIGAKYGWFNPWRLADGGGRIDEVWHFEYWAEPLA